MKRKNKTIKNIFCSENLQKDSDWKYFIEDNNRTIPKGDALREFKKRGLDVKDIHRTKNGNWSAKKITKNDGLKKEIVDIGKKVGDPSEYVKTKEEVYEKIIKPEVDKITSKLDSNFRNTKSGIVVYTANRYDDVKPDKKIYSDKENSVSISFEPIGRYYKVLEGKMDANLDQNFLNTVVLDLMNNGYDDIGSVIENCPDKYNEGLSEANSYASRKMSIQGKARRFPMPLEGVLNI